MQLVRGSELQEFLRCRKRWQWAWVDGYKPKRQAEALSFGTMIHKWLEVYYQTCNVWSADEAMREMYFNSPDIEQNSEMYDLAHKIVINYSNHYNDAAFEVIATELTFMIPLDDEIAYTGTIDLIYKQDGKLYFMDHKTTTSIEKYEKNSDMDRQISRYWWALQQLAKGNGLVLNKDGDWIPYLINHEPAGFVYNIIKKDVPEPPKVLKNGTLSKDKAQHTTYELYLQALKDHNIGSHGEAVSWNIPPEYKEMLAYLAENPREYFKRVEVIRNQREIDASIQEFFLTAKEMKYARRFAEKGDEGFAYTPVYRNITHECHSSCPFYEPCKASLDGSDVEHLLSNLYTKEEITNGYHGFSD